MAVIINCNYEIMKKEEWIEETIEKYRCMLDEKYESDISDFLHGWIRKQDEEPTQEAIEAKRQQLEDDLSDWIDREVEAYKESLESPEYDK